MILAFSMVIATRSEFNALVLFTAEHFALAQRADEVSAELVDIAEIDGNGTTFYYWRFEVTTTAERTEIDAELPF